MEIDSRKQKILSIIIDEFVKSGEPVGSKTIASMLDNSVSSATIRNDMAALERLGLLEQPHTSSGRVPTHLGYRLYIDELMKPAPLSQDEKRMIDNMLGSHVAANYIEGKKKEWDEYRTRVSSWEREKYIINY